MQKLELNKPYYRYTKIVIASVLILFCALGAHSFATKTSDPENQLSLKHTGYRVAPDRSFRYKIWHEGGEICLKFISQSEKTIDIVSVVSFVRIGVYSYGKDIALGAGDTETVKFDMVGGDVKPDFYRIEIFKASKSHHYLELQRVFLLNREPL